MASEFARLGQNSLTGYWTYIVEQAEITNFSLSGPVQTFYYDDIVGVLEYVHDPELCVGRGCAIHNHPSHHPLEKADLLWDETTKTLYRVCAHNNLHVDADHIAYLKTIGLTLSCGCDCGCCIEAFVEEQEQESWINDLPQR